MSVVKSKRGESTAEFVNTARELNIYSIQRCVSFPKRYTFYIGQEISNHANNIYSNVLTANAIHPSNKHEAQMRRDHILTAYAECEILISKIGLAHDMFGISDSSMKEWMKLLSNEQRLLNGVKKHDKEKYKDLPDI